MKDKGERSFTGVDACEVVFCAKDSNTAFACGFIQYFIGPQDLYLMVTATPMKAKFVSERVRVKMTMEDLTACIVDAFWGKS